MSKWTTRQKVAFFVCLGIVANILTIAGIGLFAYLTMFHCDYGRVYNDYLKYDDDYCTREVAVGDFEYFEKYDVGCLHAKCPIDNSYYVESYQICGSVFRMLEESDFFDVVGEDTVITIITHPYIAWDGWSCPVVGITVGDTEYLDFETGKKNWLDWLKVRSAEYGFLQTPIKEQNN